MGAAIDEFLQILAFSIVFNSVNLAYSALFVSLARTRVLIWATLGLVPWLLWPVVRGARELPLDTVLVPLLLLVPVSGMALSAQTKG